MAEYNFGAGNEVPWKAIQDGPGAFAPAYHGQPFRSFSGAADQDLLSYLQSRRISPSFLTEIDQFLSAHPEIATCFPAFQEKINAGPVLEAYKYFLTGFVKPAIYVDNVLPPLDDLRIPPLQQIPKINNKHDRELYEFFGDSYRADILLELDNEVFKLAFLMIHNGRVTYGQRRLVAYAIYGHSVDAYKYYEYNYQLIREHDRYMPDHLILAFMPAMYAPIRPNQHDKLTANVVSHPDEQTSERNRKHRMTRRRMAKDNDAGVNPIDTLLDDFTAALCRQGLRRNKVEKFRREAIASIEHQRATNGGRDIVDMVMDRAEVYRAKTSHRQGSSKKFSKSIQESRQRTGDRIDVFGQPRRYL